MRLILNAAFNVVHDYGTDLVAALLGKTRATVCHEVRPPLGGFAKFGLVDAVKVTLASGDDRILRAYAEVCGYQLLPVVEVPDCDADVSAILSRTSRMAKEFADTMVAVNESLIDGRVSQNELDRFVRETQELVTAINQVRALMVAKAESDKVQP